MAYIGRQPTVGNFRICDAISVVNGQAAYTMQVGGVNVIPESANNMIVSLNGVIQKPGSSYTVSSSTITFSSNLSTGDVIDFIQILGGVANIGTPSDGTVTNAKISYPLAQNGATVSTFNRTTSDGTILEFEKDGTAVGLVGVFSGKMHIASNGNSGIRFRDDLNGIIPCNADGSNSDADQDLGHTGVRYRRLYLSDGVFLGGTGTANKLDDYEEGTWTPSFADNSGNSVTNAGNGTYTKVGNLCLIQFAASATITSLTSTDSLRVSNLPFGGASGSGNRHATGGFRHLDSVSFSSGYTFANLVTNQNSGVLNFREFGSGVNSRDMTVSQFGSSTGTIQGSIIYRTT